MKKSPSSAGPRKKESKRPSSKMTRDDERRQISDDLKRLQHLDASNPQLMAKRRSLENRLKELDRQPSEANLGTTKTNTRTTANVITHPATSPMPSSENINSQLDADESKLSLDIDALMEKCTAIKQLLAQKHQLSDKMEAQLQRRTQRLDALDGGFKELRDQILIDYEQLRREVQQALDDEAELEELRKQVTEAETRCKATVQRKQRALARYKYIPLQRPSALNIISIALGNACVGFLKTALYYGAVCRDRFVGFYYGTA